MGEFKPSKCGRLREGRDAETPAPHVHDLLRIRPEAARFAVEPDGWVLEALNAAPWVVTRRAAPIAGWIPVGVRGEAREQRQAAQILAGDVLEILRPENLASRAPPRRHAAFDALDALTSELDATGCAWGPIGAAGFELASGHPALRSTSDLDIALRANGRSALNILAPLLRETRKLKVRVDILIETRRGGVTIDEAAGEASHVLLRSASGPRLLSRRELDEALSDAW